MTLNLNSFVKIYTDLIEKLGYAKNKIIQIIHSAVF